MAFKGSTNSRTRIKEIHLMTVTAPTTVGRIGLMRSTAVAVTPTGTVVGLPRDPAETYASLAQLETGWTTVPTVGTVATVLRRAAFAPAVGAGYIWTFDDEPLILPNSGATMELCIVNMAAVAPGTYDINFVYWE